MSPTCGNLRPHLLSDLCRRRRGVHEPVPAIRAGHLAADPSRFMVCSGIVAACGVISFIIGYASKSRSLNLKHGWLAPIRRMFEIIALSVVYASTIFLSSFALIGAASDMMGKALFVRLSFQRLRGLRRRGGVYDLRAGGDDECQNHRQPVAVLRHLRRGYRRHDHRRSILVSQQFLQLGDRTTFAARMFNSTLILAGTCIIIVSYFAISELVTTERLQRLWHDHTKADPNRGYEISHFMFRIVVLSILLTVAGLAFIGIGVFRYTPHNLLHNICAKGLPFVMLLLFVLLPWLAPRLSKAVMVASDLAALVCAAFWVNMMMGHNTLTNVEALAGLAFLGWFIVFSRQIAAIEADRIAAQLLHAQAIEGGLEQPAAEPEQQIESRIAADR